MVSDALLTGVLTIAGSVVGYSVAGWFNLRSTDKQVDAQRKQLERRLETETQRRRAEYYIERKVDILMRLYSILEETRRLYKRKADAAPYSGISEDEYDELIEQFDEYGTVMDQGMIFLDEDQQETLLNVFNILMDANGHLNNAIDNPESVDRYDFGEHGLSEFNGRFNAAEEMLQDEIKGPIDEVVQDND